MQGFSLSSTGFGFHIVTYVQLAQFCLLGQNGAQVSLTEIPIVKHVIIHFHDHVTYGIFSPAGSHFDFPLFFILQHHLNSLIYVEEQVEQQQHQKGQRTSDSAGRQIKNMLLLLLHMANVHLDLLLSPKHANMGREQVNLLNIFRNICGPLLLDDR